MSSSITLTQTTGIVTQDSRLVDPDTCLWPAESDYTEAGAVPDSVPASDDYLCRTEAGGTVEDVTTTIDVRAQDGGQPGVSARAATMAWRRSGGAPWQGWEPPISIVGYGAVEVGDATHVYAHPSILGLPSGVVLLAYTVTETGGDVGIAVRRLTAGATSWSSRSLVHDGAADGIASHPRLVLAGSMVLLLHWVESADGACWSIRVHISDDDGVTWSILRRYAIQDTDITTGGTLTRGRFSAAWQSGQLLVVAHVVSTLGTYDDKLRQYASGDYGATLVKIETQGGTSTTDTGGYPEVIATGDAFLVLYVRGSDFSIQSRRIGGAFQPLSTVETVYPGGAWDTDMAAVTGAAITDADFSACIDDAGLIWLHARCAYTLGLTDNRCVVAVSGDGGRSFNPCGVSSLDPTDLNDTGQWWLPQPGGTAATVYPTNFTSTFARGRVLLAHSHYAATATTDASVGVLTLGGYQSVPLPVARRGLSIGDRGHPVRHWIPVERPDDMGGTWTTTTTGTGASSITAAGLLQLSCPAGAGTKFYHENDATTGDLAVLMEFAVQITAGGSTSVQEVGVTIRLEEVGVHGIEVQLRISQTGYSVYDVGGATTIATVAGTGSGAKAYRIGAYSDGATRRFQVWHRLHAALDEERAWTLGVSTTTITDTGGPSGTRIRWGHITASTNTTSLWYHLCYGVADVSTGDQTVGTLSRWDEWDSAGSPEGLQGRIMSTRHIYVGDGYTMRTTQGPAIPGDTWTLQPRYQYSLSHVWPAVRRGRRVGWRSSDDGTAQTIAVALHPTILGGDTSEPLAPYWCLILEGCNWRTGSLDRYDGGWSTVTSIDLSIGGALTFVRDGSTYGPNSATTLWLPRGEVIGGTLATGAGLRRRITAQSEGRWGTGYSGPRARVTVRGGTALDAASGNCRIWSPRAAIIFPAVACAGYRIVIDAQDTVDGYHTIGRMMLGPVYLAPRRPDWQQVDEIRPGHVRRTLDDGTAIVTTQAPPTRLYELAWTDGVDESQAWGATPDPDYVAWGGGESPGAPAGLVRSIRSLVWDHDGAPVGLLPRVEVSNSALTYLRRDESLVGTMTASAELTSIVGEELSTQVHRIAALSIEEDP